MSPREFVQYSARYNKRLNRAWQSLKASKQFKPPQPSCSISSQTSDLLPQASDLALREHKRPSATATQPQKSRRPRKSRLTFDHVLPTPMSELTCNYRMVISQLQSVDPTATRANSLQRPSSESEPSCLTDPLVQKPSYIHALNSLLCCLARHADRLPGSDFLDLYCRVACHFHRYFTKNLCGSAGHC